MPYGSIDDLPDQVKSSLDTEDQKTFLAAFNSAYDGTCKDREDREECAFKIAWSAVKKTEEKENSSPDTPIQTDAGTQGQPVTEPHIRALALPFKRNQLVTQDDGSLLIKGVPMLAAGTWTDSAVGTPLYYPEKTLSEFATNWHDNTGWSRHLGGVPRDITEKVAHASNLRYENGAVTADITVHGATQKSRDTIELVKRKLISFVSVEHGGKERFNPETRQMEAESLDFYGFAFVNKGACKLCRIQESPAPDHEPIKETIPEEVDSMEIKELETKMAEIQAGYEARIKELEAKIPVQDDTRVKELEARIKELEKQPAPPVTAPTTGPKELGEVETYVIFDRKNRIARRS